MFKKTQDLNTLIPETFQEGYEKALASEGDIWLPKTQRLGDMIVRKDQIEVIWQQNPIPLSQIGAAVSYVNENCGTGIELSDGMVGHFSLGFEQRLQKPVIAGLSRLAMYGTVFQERR